MIGALKAFVLTCPKRHSCFEGFQMKYMNKLFFCLLILSGKVLHAQYYYKDLVSNQQVVADMKAYRENKVKSIKINSFESDGLPSEGFYCEKKLSKDYRSSAFFTKSDMAGNSILETYFNENGQLLRTYDSSMMAASSNLYSYDEKGRILSIVSTARSRDEDYVTEMQEEHLYSYDEAGYLKQMLKIKNRTDSLLILFNLDENNNVSIEKDTRSGAKYYYYYDNKNRLTDVVHVSEYTQQLVADYIFEYNSYNQITQMTTTEAGGKNLYTWKYRYEEGLRAEERLISKERKLLGSITYTYLYK
jgi:hypothetical protein